MKALSVFLTLCTTLTLSQAGPLNSTVLKFGGLCEYKRLHCHSFYSTFCPECDASGNFLPQQCSWSWTDRRCWCVDVITGETIPNTDTPLGTPSSHCGWFNFGERCYSFINTPKKWLEAEIYCQFDGANLASVHSEEENRFIISLTRGDTHDFPQTWLGGFDVIHPGYWIWSDGTTFNYKNCHHEDDDDHSDQHHDHDDHHKDDDDQDHDSHHDDDEDHKDEKKNCLRINYDYDLKWFYTSCADSLPFVCSKKAEANI
ncbi:hypothetical protein Q5P01_002908 [Channa striata]|uniref:Uncharacterized protein n=1 Tax=Channa striata TaxID=64152 RepID=A0AA88TEE4_CHASR|nr:hypothetical protein Q5P01_002908 [Channa striata]